jgi:hypothetical protein
MVLYRVYALDRDAHVAEPPRTLQCADDGEAIRQARQWLDGKDLEIWDGGRRVAWLPHSD